MTGCALHHQVVQVGLGTEAVAIDRAAKYDAVLDVRYEHPRVGACHYACPGDEAGTSLAHAQKSSSFGCARLLDPGPLHTEIALVYLHLAAKGFQFRKRQNSPSDPFAPEVHGVPVNIDFPGTDRGRGLLLPFVKEWLQLVPTEVGVFAVRMQGPPRTHGGNGRRFCGGPLSKGDRIRS